jgi:hypothetical protein
VVTESITMKTEAYCTSVKAWVSESFRDLLTRDEGSFHRRHLQVGRVEVDGVLKTEVQGSGEEDGSLSSV